MIEFALNATTSFASFFVAAQTCRSEVAEALSNDIRKIVDEEFVRDVIGDIDELSTHHWIDESVPEDVNIVRLDDEGVEYEVLGTVYVTQQYGSNSDVENDMGAVTNDNFPFRILLSAPIEEPENLSVLSFNVDTSKHYA